MIARQRRLGFVPTWPDTSGRLRLPVTGRHQPAAPLAEGQQAAGGDEAASTARGSPHPGRGRPGEGAYAEDAGQSTSAQPRVPPQGYGQLHERGQRGAQGSPKAGCLGLRHGPVRGPHEYGSPSSLRSVDDHAGRQHQHIRPGCVVKPVLWPVVLRQLLCSARKPVEPNVGVGEGNGGELDGALDAVQAGSLCQIRVAEGATLGVSLQEPPGAGAGGGTLLVPCAWAAAVGKLTAGEVRATEAFGPRVAKATAEAGMEELVAGAGGSAAVGAFGGRQHEDEEEQEPCREACHGGVPLAPCRQHSTSVKAYGTGVTVQEGFAHQTLRIAACCLPNQGCAATLF